MKRLVTAATLIAGSLYAFGAHAITRDEILTRARAFSFHPWTSATANLTASCSPAYHSLHVPGDHVGVAYDWGGYMSLYEFDQKIAAGYGAGSQETDGVLDCTAGVDCSGFVSQVWSIGHFTTSNLAQTSAQIMQSELLPGDVFNMAGYHVAMYTATLASGEPSMIEAIGYNVHVNTTGGWSHVTGYLPRRFNSVTGTTATVPAGTPTTPIAIASFPYTDQRNTLDSTSRLFDRCAAAPTVDQSGPEYVYSVNITEPGTLTVSVADDASTDIDVQLLTSPSPEACVARNDSSLSRLVGCGTYYVVADTFGSAAGAYTLTATFAPSGQACGSVPGPPVANPLGKLGEACQYPGDQNLPFCNPNLGGITCVYTQTTSFCSTPCGNASDCDVLPGGGCCEDLGKGELYCVTKPLCAATLPDGGTPDAATNDGGGGSGGNGAGDAGGSTGDPSSGAGGDESGGLGAAPERPAGGGSETITTSGCALSPSSPRSLGGTQRAVWALLACAWLARRFGRRPSIRRRHEAVRMSGKS